MKMSWKGDEAAAQNAYRVLPRVLQNYYKAGRHLDQASPARSMHRFRLKTKHLRYTLEVFVPLFGAGFERKMQTLRPIQNALGDLNDCEVLLEEMRHRLPRDTRAFIEKRADEKREEFLRYWREEFDIADEDKKWQQYLKRPAQTRPAR